MSQLVMNGLENLEGRTFGTLTAVRMIKRHPEPHYAVTCKICGAESSASHTRLRNGAARCRASDCGKPSRMTSRELLLEQKRISAERDAEAERAAIEASAARMEAETGDHRLMRSRPIIPANTAPESERQRLERRAWNAEVERERLNAERPIREAEQRAAIEQAEAEEQWKATANQLAQIERERITSGKDDAFEIDPATVGESAAVPIAQIDTWHAAQSTQFLADNPSYYRCRENETAMLAYIERNAPGLKLLSAVQLTAAYRRLRDFGLLKERPAPAPAPETPAPKRVNPSVAPEKPKDDGSETGWDWTSGQPLTLTARQVALLPADDYRRFKKLDKAALELPNVGPSLKRYA